MKPKRIVISRSSTRKHGFWTEEVVYKFFYTGKIRSITRHERILHDNSVRTKLLELVTS